MNLTDRGGLIIQATKASGALPVPNSTVRIRGAEESNRFVVYSVITDIDGNTQAVTLPAPARIYSTESNPPQSPYSIYDIEITADGYYPKKIYSVAVFPGIIATQPINMIPLSENEDMTSFPRGNLNAIVKENEKL